MRTVSLRFTDRIKWKAKLRLAKIGPRIKRPGHAKVLDAIISVASQQIANKDTAPFIYFGMFFMWCVLSKIGPFLWTTKNTPRHNEVMDKSWGRGFMDSTWLERIWGRTDEVSWLNRIMKLPWPLARDEIHIFSTHVWSLDSPHRHSIIISSVRVGRRPLCGLFPSPVNTGRSEATTEAKKERSGKKRRTEATKWSNEMRQAMEQSTKLTE